MQSPIIPVATAINHSYLLPLAVMIDSMCRRLSPNTRPVLYLIHAGMPGAALEPIASCLEMHPIVASQSQLAAAPRDPRFPPEAAIPLLLAELLPPTLERVLFLDADMLVLDDLMKLWETSMDGHVVAAACDGAIPLCSSPRGVKDWHALGIPRDAPYFNGGVLLIDLPRWREREVNRRVQHYFDRTGDGMDFLHQEALNAVLWNDWKQLDPRWNLLASRAGRSYERGTSQAWRQPGIIHFAGRMKPWRAPIGGPFNELYQESLQRVRSAVAPEPATLRDHFHSVYDRYLRTAFYPLEQYLWKQRLI